MSQRVAIIGAGAKGAAIVAKAAALKTGGHTRPPPDIDLYDDQSIGASWRGASGYTDGEQPLCTLAERDLGFPYDVQPWGRAVIAEMLSQFSWQAFSVTAPGRMRYNDWIVDGRRPPAHRVFADYLQHAVDAAIGAHVAKHVPRRVGSVDFDRGAGKWLVDSFDSGSRTTQQERYDGIVITGSGRPLPDLPNANPRVFNGQTFWSSIAQIRTLLMADLDPSVVIIGAGGTAAAIAYWFVRKGLVALPILIVGHEATLFARHDGPFEDRMFSDDVAWQALAPHVKDAFLSRTTAGVVWDYVLRNLRSDNIGYESYSARGFQVLSPAPKSRPPFLALELDAPPIPRTVATPGATIAPVSMMPIPPLTTREATVFIDARGFDRWWFVNELFAGSTLQSTLKDKAGVRRTIGVDFCVRSPIPGQPFPDGLHVPAIGDVQGPAASNLMALGWIADRVLSRYC